jgi:glutathione peroxidase
MTRKDSPIVKNETFKQKALRILYPFIRKIGKRGKNGIVLMNENETQPASSFYELDVELNNGKTLGFSAFKGRKVLLVNTASNCGYTGQYAELQSLHQRYGTALQIIAFPANDFAQQEQGDDADIARFCQVNYGVSFPVVKKGVVIKKTGQQPVFKWLSDKELNGWNDHEPDWNFSKYLIDEKGNLTHYFGPSISPLEDDFLKAVD